MLALQIFEDQHVDLPVDIRSYLPDRHVSSVLQWIQVARRSDGCEF